MADSANDSTTTDIQLWAHAHEGLCRTAEDDFGGRIVVDACITEASGGVVSLANLHHLHLTPAEARDIAASLLIAAEFATPIGGVYGEIVGQR